MDGRPQFSSSTSYMRKSATDTTAITDVVKKHVKRSSEGIWLISLFLFVYFLVSCVFAILSFAIDFMNFSTSDMLRWTGEILIDLFGMLTASLGFYSVSTQTLPDARRFFRVLLVLGLVYLFSLLTTAVIHFNSLSNYLEEKYAFSLMNSLTSISLAVVIVAYIVVSFILKAYNFQKSIQQMMDVQPKTERPKVLPTILDR